MVSMHPRSDALNTRTPYKQKRLQKTSKTASAAVRRSEIVHRGRRGPSDKLQQNSADRTVKPQIWLNRLQIFRFLLQIYVHDRQQQPFYGHHIQVNLCQPAPPVKKWKFLLFSKVLYCQRALADGN